MVTPSALHAGDTGIDTQDAHQIIIGYVAKWFNASGYFISMSP